MIVQKRYAHLEKEVEKLKDKYGREATRHKRTALLVRLCSVFVAAAITVLLGVHWAGGETPVWASNTALVLGSVITVLSAYDAFFDPRVLWIRETITFARLKDLHRDIAYWGAGGDAAAMTPKEAEAFEARLDGFKARLDGILADTLRHWIRVKGGGVESDAVSAVVVGEGKREAVLTPSSGESSASGPEAVGP